MLSDAAVVPVVGVKEMARAKEFYEGKLGLKAAKDDDDMAMYQCGDGTMLMVYQTEFGGTNKATGVAWNVEDIEAEMKDMKAKGVEFEDYDMPGLKTENGVATYGDNEKAAWFKDPDGNILCVTQM